MMSKVESSQQPDQLTLLLNDQRQHFTGLMDLLLQLSSSVSVCLADTTNDEVTVMLQSGEGLPIISNETAIEINRLFEQSNPSIQSMQIAGKNNLIIPIAVDDRKGLAILCCQHMGSPAPTAETLAMLEKLGAEVAKKIELLTAKSNSESAEKFGLGNFFSLNLDLLCVANLDGYFLRVNDAWRKHLGQTSEELLSKKFLDFVHPDDRKATKNAMNQLGNQEEVVDFINRYKAADGTYHYLEWHAKPAGNLVYAAARDITERVLISTELKDSLERNKLLANLSLEGILIHKNGLVVDVNKAYENMSGYVKDELVGKNIFDLVHPDDHEMGRHYVAIKYSKPYEIRGLRKSGEHFYAELEARNFHWQNEEYRVVAVRDISHRRMAQLITDARAKMIDYSANHSLSELLTYSLDYIGNLVNSPIGFYHFIEEDQLTISLQQWSTNTLKVYCTANPEDRHYPLDKAGVWADCVRQGVPIIHNDYAALTNKKGLPEGHASLIRELVVPVKRNNRVVAILGVGNKLVPYIDSDMELVSYLADVTWEIVERKMIEENLKENELKHRLLFANSPDAYFLIAEGKLIDCNKATEKLLGMEKKELMGKSPDYFSPEFQPTGIRSEILAKEKINEAFEKGACTFEWQHKKASGDVFWAQVSLAPMMMNGKEVLFTILRDISIRKRTQEILEASEKRFQLFMDETPVFAYIKSEELHHIYENRRIKELTKRVDAKGELHGSGSYFEPDVVKRIEATDKLILSGGERRVELEFPYLDGDEIKWLHDIKFLLTLPDNKKAIGGMAFDITKLKQTTHDLERTANLLGQAQRIANMGAWELDLVTNNVHLTKEVYHILEAPNGSINTWRETISYLHPDDIHKITSALDHAIASEQPFDIIAKLITDERKQKWVRISGQLEVDVDTPVKLIGMMQDVTKQEETNESIRHEKEFSNMLIENMADGFILVDATGKLLYVNHELSQMTGYKYDELIGKLAPYPFWPEEESKRLVQNLQSIIKQGKGSTEQIFRRKSGERFSVIINLATYTDENGQPTNFFATIKDISRRKTMEEDLKAKLQYMQLLSAISSKAVIVNNISEFVEDCLKTIGNYLGVDRVWMESVDAGKGSFTTLGSWASKNKFKANNIYQEFPELYYAEWINDLRNGRIINISNINELESEEIKKVLTIQHIRSILVIPMFVANRFFGFLSFEHCDRSHVWPSVEQDLLLTLTRIIAGVFERKASLDQVTSSEYRHRLLADNATDVIWTMDFEGRLTYVSPSVFTLFGIPQEEVAISSSIDILTSDEVRKYLQTIRGAFKKNGVKKPIENRSFEFQVANNQQSTKWIESTISGLYDDSRNLIGILGVNRDITEKKIAAKRLALQGDFQKMVADLSTDLISAGIDNIDNKINNLLELVGRFFRGDRCYLIIFDEENKTLTNTHEWCAEGIKPAIEILQKVPYLENQWILENLIKHEILYIEDVNNMPPDSYKDQALLQMQEIKSLLNMLISYNGRPIGLVGFDAVSEKRSWSDYDASLLRIVANLLGDALAKIESEKALITAKNQADYANKAKSEFLSKMTHELRTPLNGVIGFTDLLQNTPLSEIQKQYLSTAHNSARTLLDIINDILDLAKIEADKMELDTQPVELEQMIAKIVDVISYQAHSKNLELVIALGENIPQTLVLDELKVKQTLINLLNNAVKFTERGEIVLSVKLISKAEKKATLRFAVADTGIGIPAQNRDRIFEAFTQASAGTSKLYGGTGLGLTIASKLLHLMGSELMLESEVGKGSTFYFEVAFEIAPNVPQTSPSSPAKEAVIVDKNKISGDVIANYFNSQNIEAFVLPTFDEAVDYLKQSISTNLVLFDQKAATTDNFEGLHRLLLLADERADLRILPLVASNTTESEIIHYNDLGLQYFLYKPVLPKSLASKIKLLFEAQSSSKVEVLDQSKAPQQHASILVAEDNPVNMMLVIAYLTELFASARVIEATDGKMALEKFIKYQPNLVITDIQMPEMNGYELSEAIRKLTIGKDVPIIALTARALKGEDDRCREAGMNDILVKPVMQQPFRQTIQKWLKIAEEEVKPEQHPKPMLESVEQAEVAMAYDRPFVIQLCGGNMTFYNALIKEVKDELDRSEVKLREELESTNLQNLGFAAHKLKGTAQSLKAKKLADLSKEIELKAKGGEQVTSESIANLLHLLDLLRKDIVAELANE